MRLTFLICLASMCLRISTSLASFPQTLQINALVCDGNGNGLKKSIPTIREREGNEKKNIPKIREREKGMKKSIPIIWEWEGNEKIHSHNSGTGIRGFHSWEWTGKGIPAHPCCYDINTKNLECIVCLCVGKTESGKYSLTLDLVTSLY